MKYLMMILIVLGFSCSAFAAADCTNCTGTDDSEQLPEPGSLEAKSPVHERGQLSADCFPPESLEPTAQTAALDRVDGQNGSTNNGNGENTN